MVSTRSGAKPDAEKHMARTGHAAKARRPRTPAGRSATDAKSKKEDRQVAASAAVDDGAVLSPSNASKRARQDKTQAGRGAKSRTDARDQTTQHHDHKPETDRLSRTVEKGLIYFFFRPKVAVEHVTSADDIQRMYIVLHPLTDNEKLEMKAADVNDNVHILIVPKKHLPKRPGRDRFIALVASGEETVSAVRTDLGELAYNTATRGERVQGAARPVDEGVYCIVKDKDGRTTHLAYKLSVPVDTNSAQETLGVSQRGFFIISVKNPESKPVPGTPQQKPDLPGHLKAKFSGKAWIGVDDSEFFSYPNTQLLLIGERTELKNDMKGGFENSVGELFRLSEEDESRLDAMRPEDVVFDDLKLDETRFSKDPLKGKFA